MNVFLPEIKIPLLPCRYIYGAFRVIDDLPETRDLPGDREEEDCLITSYCLSFETPGGIIGKKKETGCYVRTVLLRVYGNTGVTGITIFPLSPLCGREE